jgi:hypothetical protein
VGTDVGSLGSLEYRTRRQEFHGADDTFSWMFTCVIYTLDIPLTWGEAGKEYNESVFGFGPIGGAQCCGPGKA